MLQGSESPNFGTGFKSSALNVSCHNNHHHSATQPRTLYSVTSLSELGHKKIGDKDRSSKLLIYRPSINPENLLHNTTITMPDTMSSAVSSTGSSPPPKRRRRRPARSCEQCRRRKIKCNLAQPCNGCVRARAPMQCSYRDVSPVEAAPYTSGDRSLMPSEARTEREGVVPAPQRNTEVQSNTGHYPRDQVSRPPRSQVIDTAVPNRGNRLAEPVASIRPSVSTPSSTSIPPFTPRLRHVPEKTKLFGQTHWLHTAEKVSFQHQLQPDPNTSIVSCLWKLSPCRDRAIMG
jgi:hypothetical protein